MSALLLLLFVSAVVTKENDKASTITENLQKLRQIVLEKIKADSSRSSRDLPAPEDNKNKMEAKESGSRTGKSYGYYPYLPYNFQSQDLGYYFPQGKTPMSQEWRTEPFKRKNPQQLVDSPIYYVRLPASPYVFIPGVGYVSRPPSLNEPGVLNALTDSKPDPPVNQNNDIHPSNFIHVPIDFLSNGKPTSVYQLPNEPVVRPKPDSLFLDKGPYLFNGKPIELYVLRNSYNRIFADALTNFYP